MEKGVAMSLDEFIRKYDRNYVEVNGSALNQCVDLANRYIIDVLNEEPIFYKNAKDFWDAANDNYERILNSDTAIPQAGDIIIWDAWEYGHIAVATGLGDTGWFQSFDQNFPIGSVCHLVDHNYNNVKGWLRYKKGNNMDKEELREAVSLIYLWIWEQLHSPSKANKDSIWMEAVRDSDRFLDGDKDSFNRQLWNWFCEGNLAWIKRSECDEKSLIYENRIKDLNETKDGYIEIMAQDTQKIELLKVDIERLKKYNACNIYDVQTKDIISELWRRFIEIFRGGKN